jgi:hypothetical protein
VALDLPRYIAASGCQQGALRYSWDDWDLDQFESPVDESLLARLSAVAQRANVAWCIACAEWICHRLAPHLHGDPLPLQRLEAAWAQVVDARYSHSLVADPQLWAGPVKRPVLRALELVDFAVDAMTRDESPAPIGAAISRLTDHLLADPGPFRCWQARTLERLEALYLLDSDETLGEVVPREALDPERDFDPRQTEVLVSDFLTRLSREDNPFLLSPSEMLARGFPGVPYLFSAEADRELRFRW